jgi:CheY-like chemotaxis protein
MNPTLPHVILMAEDDSDDRLLVQEAITESKWSGDVHFVENGEELMDYLGKRGEFSPPAAAPKPGLILLDLNMPKMDGKEVIAKIRENPEFRKIPVVVLTTSKADTDIDEVYELGANSFITKPVQFEALVNVMKLLNDYWFKAVVLPANRS